MRIVPDAAYNVLKATNRLNGCLFIFQFEYKMVEDDGKIADKTLQYAFKIVSDREYNMYKEMEEFNKIKDHNDSIIRPRKRE